MEKPSGRLLRDLKAKAQRIEPMFKVGKAGLSPAFCESVSQGLEKNGLVKIRFDEFKTEKKKLGPELAERTASHVIMQVGHVVVLYRAKPETGTETAAS